MSIWWDEDAKKYRSSLPHKIFHKYGFRPIRYILFHLPSEFAHHRGIEGIWLIHKIDQIYLFLKLLIIIPLLLAIRLLSLLPGFSLSDKRED